MDSTVPAAEWVAICIEVALAQRLDIDSLETTGATKHGSCADRSASWLTFKEAGVFVIRHDTGVLAARGTIGLQNTMSVGRVVDGIAGTLTTDCVDGCGCLEHGADGT